MAEIDAYNEALKSGQYQKPGGLLGKYDNVRRFWEDEQLGVYLSPYLEKMVNGKKECGEKIRVFDIGCGGGDGFEFLTGIDYTRPLISDHKSKVILPEMLELYHGIDINDGLLEQARAIFTNKPNILFMKADCNDFDFSAEKPYDLYFANYGTLSHNNDEQNIELLSKIANHGNDGALIVIDWLGRFSYEWQTLWTRDLKNNQWIDYAISYIYSEDDEEKPEITSFPLRIMGRDEVLNILRQANRKSSGIIKLRKLADRSSFVGRHIDTRQYNPHCQPLRRLVNSLFELNIGTNLDELMINYVPGEGFHEVNAYHVRLVNCWNYLVSYVQALLKESALPVATFRIPQPLKSAMTIMKKTVTASKGAKIGTPRASLIEPQLGYCLRQLEIDLQEGLGCGHGLVAIFEISK